MTERDWIDELTARGALWTGHFLLSSGRHSATYVQCARALEDPALAERMGRALADRMEEGFDRVIAPPLGGLLIGHEVARAAGRRFLFPERGSDGGFRLRRGFSIDRGERLLIVEDVVTTGRTTEELVALVEAAGGRPVGVAAIIDRTARGFAAGRRIRALAHVTAETYAPQDCPECRRGAALDRPGSRPPDPKNLGRGVKEVS